MSETEAQAALFAALAEAIKDTSAVVKRGQGQGYLYAEAEAVVAEADRVMSPRGLIVAPGPATVENAGDFETKNGKRTLFVLRREFVVCHKDGGRLDGGAVCIALGTNLGATPPQATTSAATTALAYFLKDLLRMPRAREEDVEHPRNNRPEREEREPDPARPSVTPPAARKVTRVLAAVAAIKDVAGWDAAREKWDRVLAERTPEDDCGYTAAECEAVKKALAEAAARVGA